jgi:hypothetical protein
MTIELTEDEFQLLILAIGMAIGSDACLYRPNRYRLFALANAVNRNNPKWIPYEIPDLEKGEGTC